MLINGCGVCGNELFVLRCILQTHVRLEQPIDQFTFLVLPAGVRESSQEQTRRQKSSHMPKLPKQRLLCKGNCRSAALFGSVDQLAKAFGVNGQLDGQADGMRYASGRLSFPKGEGRVRVYSGRLTPAGHRLHFITKLSVKTLYPFSVEIGLRRAS